MRRIPGQNTGGVIGCLDPDGSRWKDLDAWATGHGARRWCDEGRFRLWAWPRTPARMHQVRTGALSGLVAGDLYPAHPPSSPPADDRDLGNSVAASFMREAAAWAPPSSGQYAAYLWDRDRQELLLFRDHSGARSIYYAEIPDGGMVFADDLDLLVAGPLVEKRLARPSLHEFLRFLDVSTPRTIYDRVFSTEPGVLFRAGIDRRAHEPGKHTRAVTPPQSLAEAAAGLERRLAAAVTARVDPHGTTVVFLSGGVDSALVCSLAASPDSSRIAALTVGFEESGFDESRVAQRVARHLGVRHHVLSFPMATYRDVFEEFTAAIQHPFADPAGIPTLLAFRAAREIGETALDGTGADTLFGIMPARHQRLAVQFGTLLPLRLRRLAARGIKALPGVRKYAPLVDFDDPEEILIRWRGWTRCEIERLCGEDVSLSHTRFYRLFRQFPRDAHLQRYSALLGNLPDDRIHQAAALTGLDVRFPYFDPSVRELVEAMDPNLRYHPAEPKRVLKAVLGGRVPRELWDVPKHGFDFPFVDLMRADDCALVRTYLDPALTGRWGLFDQEQLDGAVDAFIRSDRAAAFTARSLAFRIWALVVLFAWLTNHFSRL